MLGWGAVERLLLQVFLQAHREAPKEIILLYAGGNITPPDKPLALYRFSTGEHQMLRRGWRKTFSFWRFAPREFSEPQLLGGWLDS